MNLRQSRLREDEERTRENMGHQPLALDRRGVFRRRRPSHRGEDSGRHPRCDQDAAPPLGEEKADREEEARKLLKCVARGDSAAFWKLWEGYQQYLYYVCLRQMGGIHEDAEDALSRSMLKAWGELPNYAREIHNLKAWLTKLTYNLCVDIHRERKRCLRGAENIEEITSQAPVAWRMIESPEDALLNREMSSYIRRAVDDLPLRLREPFMLRFFQGTAYRDIAQQLSLSADNVRKRIQQARAILQEKLNHYLTGLYDTVREQSSAQRSTPGLKARAAAEPARTVKEAEGHLAASLTPSAPPSGGERGVHRTLHHQPTRQDLKVGTLSRYIQRHPRGWKKRLELACLLSAMGRWEEALETYHEVLQRQPRLLGVYVQLGGLLRLMRREAEAITVYERALPLAREFAARNHLHDLIENCRQPAERSGFKELAPLAPSSPVHWRPWALASWHADQGCEAVSPSLSV